MHCGLLGVKQEEVFPKEEKEFDIRGGGDGRPWVPFLDIPQHS